MNSKQLSPLFRITLGTLLLGMSFYFIIGTAHFYRLTPQDLGKYFDIKWVLLTHISFGMVALITGPFQLWKEFRSRYMQLHRNMGKAYVLSVLLSGVCAVYLSFTTAYAINWAYAFSAQVWVSVWLSATGYAYITARQRKFKLHKEWMVRSYIATFSFTLSATLLKLPIIQSLGSFADISPSFFWVSWSVPMYVYSLVLSYQRKQ